jgi:hypothetical protein
MPFVQVLKPFLHRERYYRQGEVLALPEDILDGRDDHVEVVVSRTLPKITHLMQQNASDFVRFCMAHENSYHDGRCPVKRDRMDPMSKYLGWQLKNNFLKP